MVGIAIVGSGPTCIYTLKGLIEAEVPIVITIFETHRDPGKGTPYYPATNDRAMLANIASVELPPITETLVQWLHRQSDQALQELGTTRDLIAEREFYPRILIGEYLHDQFWKLIKVGIDRGHAIDVKAKTKVVDVRMLERSIELDYSSGEDDRKTAQFDHVVLATGHSWPDKTETSPGYFVSPWPASGLDTIGNCPVAVLGTSLSGIDAVVSVATSHGTFLLDAAEQLQYHVNPEHADFSLTMMSRKGLLPEADFYCAYPYAPLEICNDDAVGALVAAGPAGLLDKTFELFKSELALADPDYASRIGLSTATVETLAEKYFSEREATDPFVWAAMNLAEAEQNRRLKHTVGWRYAILRMHEVVARIVPHLDETDLKRFHQHFKTVFVDDYATVPHQSIKRLLALHQAGRLSVRSLGEDYDISLNQGAPGVTVVSEGDETVYDAFIDATGQHALSARDLPFPSLHGVVKAALTPSSGALEELEGQGVRTGGVDLDDQFRPRIADSLCNRLYCVAISFLLHKLPFVQGITSSRELGDVVSQAILADLQRLRGPGSPTTSERTIHAAD
jgi:uncharacterized NAD(P)/FAD-binding protein YdhS